MVLISLDENDRIDWAIKSFKKKVMRAGIMKELRRRRHYEKPSQVRNRKAAAAKRRLFLASLPPRKRSPNGAKRKRF
jgi:small subunit ribosomal protein S21